MLVGEIGESAELADVAGVGFRVVRVADQPLVAIEFAENRMRRKMAAQIIGGSAGVLQAVLAGSEKRGYRIAERGESIGRLHGGWCVVHAARHRSGSDLSFPRATLLFGFGLRGALETALNQFDQCAIGYREMLHVFENGPAIG